MALLGWTGLPHLVRACANEDPPTAARAIRRLGRFSAWARRSFVEPPKDVLHSIDDALAAAAPRIPELSLAGIRFWLDPWRR